MSADTGAQAPLAVEVDLARGAKIVSLREPDGFEWLAQRAPDRPTGPGRAFVDAEMAGWDECAPSIVACRVNGREVPDHGDLWDVPFRAVGDVVEAVGESLGYRFSRRVVPVSGGARFEYHAEALDGPVPFLWAAHPQFAAPAGTRVELPGVTEVVDVLDPALPTVPWTAALATIDSVEPGGCRKVYAPPTTSVSCARLVRPGGRALELTWSAECAYVGVWFDGTAYSAEPVIAIEPTTGYFDRLDRAIAAERVPVLEPGIPFTWWVEVRASEPGARGTI